MVYLKNIGLPLLLVLFSLFEKNPWHKRLLLGSLVILIPAELVLFQPNAYDNNKLLYVAGRWRPSRRRTTRC